MSFLSPPHYVWQYANDVSGGATTQYSNILGDTAAVNPNPLAVDTLIQYVKGNYGTGIILYDIDGSPFYSGGNNLTAAGIAKLRAFVAQCSTEGLAVAVVWGGDQNANGGNGSLPTGFALALANYNNTVAANEKIIACFLEYEFWNGTKKAALATQITSCNAVKPTLNAAGIDLYDYLGHTHAAGYQYSGDSTPITVNEIEQLEGTIDVFALHDYARIPNWGYVDTRALQLTTPQRVQFIISDESPDDNASGGFDPVNSYFEAWFEEGRDTSITPVAPNNPPPIIYPPKSIIDCYNYICQDLPTATPPQSGSPSSYEVESNPLKNNSLIEGIICFTWSYTHNVVKAPAIPPTVPIGLLPWSELPAVSHRLLVDILYTLINSPLAPTNPLPTDYGDLYGQQEILLYDILLALTNGGGSGGIGTAVIDITVAGAIALDASNGWLSGRTYRITDPPLPIKSYIAQAVPNVASGQIRLNNIGTCEVYNFNGSTYDEKCFCMYNFNLGLDDITIITPRALTIRGSAMLYTNFNLSEQSTILDLALTGSTSGFTNGVRWQSCQMINTGIDFAGFEEPSFYNCNMKACNIVIDDDNTSFTGCNFQDNVIILNPKLYQYVNVGENTVMTGFASIDHCNFGNNCAISDDTFFTLTMTSCECDDGNTINVTQTQSSSSIRNGVSNFRFTLDLSDSTYFDPLQAKILTLPLGMGRILITDTVGGNAMDVTRMSAPGVAMLNPPLLEFSVDATVASQGVFSFKEIGNSPDDILALSLPVINSAMIMDSEFIDKAFLQLSRDGLNWYITTLSGMK